MSASSSSGAHNVLFFTTSPGYSLYSFLRIQPHPRSLQKSHGGGSAFLVREPVIVLNCSRHAFKSFACSSITLKLGSDTLTVYNIYRPVAETWRRVWGRRKTFSRTKVHFHGKNF